MSESKIMNPDSQPGKEIFVDEAVLTKMNLSVHYNQTQM
jgi:hypothetical protein